ncbi:MAG: hypothetical protein IJF83_03235 [Methanobrevibacter sp.]|nr:hypothetical protein [Methanobrevibacter sp.]
MKAVNKKTGEEIDLAEELTREEIEEIIHEAVEKTINESINEMTIELMTMHSLSLGEAQHIATKFLLSGVTPKSEEFYKRADNIKTAWEV